MSHHDSSWDRRPQHADGAPRSMVLTGAAGLYRRMAKRMCSLKPGATSPATDRNTARSEAPAVATRHLQTPTLACQGASRSNDTGPDTVSAAAKVTLGSTLRTPLQA
jgi:hypothetical protein